MFLNTKPYKIPNKNKISLLTCFFSANEKWFTRYMIGNIICTELKKLDLAYPEISDDEKNALLKAKESLLNEK